MGADERLGTQNKYRLQMRFAVTSGVESGETPPFTPQSCLGTYKRITEKPEITIHHGGT